MDVHCSTCDEPWDVHHLWQDAIYETGVSDEEARMWRTLPQRNKLSEEYRNKFRAVGWQFGQSVINVVRCPCCPLEASPDPEKVHTKAALEELLGEDEDGLAATFEDHHL